MRQRFQELKDHLNEQIELEKDLWKFTSGSNYGIKFQSKVSIYFSKNKTKLKIAEVKTNLNPNSPDADIVITKNNGKKLFIEVKSCKDGALSGVTICNSPELLSNVPCILINYTVENSYVIVQDVIFTELHRLVTINKKGKYEGCLSSTRDTGKKIKGRNYNEFITSTDKEDYTLEELTEPALIRKTILTYSASKLVDAEYNFTDEEILMVIQDLRKYG